MPEIPDDLKGRISGEPYIRIPRYWELAEYLQDPNSYQLGGVYIIRRKNKKTYVYKGDNIDYAMEINNPSVQIPYEFTAEDLEILEKQALPYDPTQTDDSHSFKLKENLAPDEPLSVHNLSGLQIEQTALNLPGPHLNAYVYFLELKKPLDREIVDASYFHSGEPGQTLYCPIWDDSLLLMTYAGNVRILRTRSRTEVDLTSYLGRLPSSKVLFNRDFWDTIHCTEDIVLALNMARERIFYEK
jgi:hypothetical protein